MKEGHIGNNAKDIYHWLPEYIGQQVLTFQANQERNNQKNFTSNPNISLEIYFIAQPFDMCFKIIVFQPHFYFVLKYMFIHLLLDIHLIFHDIRYSKQYNMCFGEYFISKSVINKKYNFRKYFCDISLNPLLLIKLAEQSYRQP